MSQIGNGLQAFGQAMSRMGEAHLKAQAEVELEQAANIIQERMNAFNRQLEMDGDWENYETKWNKEQEALKKMLQEGRLVGVDSREMSFKTNLARRETENLFARASVAQEARVLEKQQRSHMTHLAITEEENLDRKIKNYTPETIGKAGGDIAKSAAYMMQYGLMDEAQARNWTAAKADGAVAAATNNAARNAFNMALSQGVTLEGASSFARQFIRGENAASITVGGTTYATNEGHLKNADRLVEDLYTQFDDEFNQRMEIGYGDLLAGEPTELTMENLDKGIATWETKLRWRQKLETHLNVMGRKGATDDTQADQILGVLYYAASQGKLPGGTMLPVFSARWGKDGTSFTRESLSEAIDDVADIVIKQKGKAGSQALVEIREMLTKTSDKTTGDYAGALIDRYIDEGKLTPEESVILKEYAYDYMKNHPGGQSSPEALRDLEDVIKKQMKDNLDKMNVKSMTGIISGDAYKVTKRFEEDDIPMHRGRVLFLSRADQAVADEYAANAEREITEATGWKDPTITLQKGAGYLFTNIDGDTRQVARFTSKYDRENRILIEEYDGRILKGQYIMDGKNKIEVVMDGDKYVSKAKKEKQDEKNASERQKVIERREAEEKARRRIAVQGQLATMTADGENVWQLVESLEYLKAMQAASKTQGGGKLVQGFTEKDRDSIIEIERKLSRIPLYHEWKALGE